jgi:hypothetical protein
MIEKHDRDGDEEEVRGLYNAGTVRKMVIQVGNVKNPVLVPQTFNKGQMPVYVLGTAGKTAILVGTVRINKNRETKIGWCDGSHISRNIGPSQNQTLESKMTA